MVNIVLEEDSMVKSNKYCDMRCIKRCFVRPNNVTVNVYFNFEYEKDGLMYYSYHYTFNGIASDAEIKQWLRGFTLRAPWKATGNARAIVL